MAQIATLNLPWDHGITILPTPKAALYPSQDHTS